MFVFWMEVVPWASFLLMVPFSFYISQYCLFWFIVINFVLVRNNKVIYCVMS